MAGIIDDSDASDQTPKAKGPADVVGNSHVPRYRDPRPAEDSVGYLKHARLKTVISGLRPTWRRQFTDNVTSEAYQFPSCGFAKDRGTSSLVASFKVGLLGAEEVVIERGCMDFWLGSRNFLSARFVNGLMKILMGSLLAMHMSAVGFGSPQDSCKSTVVGDLRIEHFQSKTFDRMMTVRVWLPPDYNDATQATKKFPTLYMLDGQNAFDQCTAFKGEQELRIDETVTRLIASHTIAPMIVVGIDCAHGEGRDYEYEAWKDPLTAGNQKEPAGKQLPSFFGSELIPFVAARYRVSDDAAHTGIGGTSLGAFAALYVALDRPDLFGLALVESPDLWLGNGQLLRDTTSLLRAPDRVAIGVGATEYNFPQSKEFFDPLRLNERDAEAATVKMNQILASNLEHAFIKRPEVQLVIEPGANHSAVFWSGRIPGALTFLYGEPGQVH